MPRIRRQKLPESLFLHLATRVHERQISSKDLMELSAWLDTEPIAPTARWFKRFPGFTLCGEGELVKTFLLPNQAPTGTEMP